MYNSAVWKRWTWIVTSLKMNSLWSLLFLYSPWSVSSQSRFRVSWRPNAIRTRSRLCSVHTLKKSLPLNVPFPVTWECTVGISCLSQQIREWNFARLHWEKDQPKTKKKTYFALHRFEVCFRIVICRVFLHRPGEHWNLFSINQNWNGVYIFGEAKRCRCWKVAFFRLCRSWLTFGLIPRTYKTS